MIAHIVVRGGGGEGRRFDAGRLQSRLRQMVQNGLQNRRRRVGEVAPFRLEEDRILHALQLDGLDLDPWLGRRRTGEIDHRLQGAGLENAHRP
ncbi:hypothetical protein JZU48_04080, partial [bacterium]|nr:hypothetical protein [bacterium]